ncbi:hypothetical protein EYF80_043957 [Liparis tanakae]|uniref:Uncharacterized protein n=1 Tax=Liparis tanakae TaxID=230148 RepID=A0A4Z2FZN8_9TELE|nr:hypothetical protein EYF80_043957 [Liparis tanakae]
MVSSPGFELLRPRALVVTWAEPDAESGAGLLVSADVSALTTWTSSPFQSAGSWKGHQAPQRTHCRNAARDAEVADSCAAGKRHETQTPTGKDSHSAPEHDPSAFGQESTIRTQQIQYQENVRYTTR